MYFPPVFIWHCTPSSPLGLVMLPYPCLPSCYYPPPPTWSLSCSLIVISPCTPPSWLQIFFIKDPLSLLLLLQLPSHLWPVLGVDGHHYTCRQWLHLSLALVSVPLLVNDRWWCWCLCTYLWHVLGVGGHTYAWCWRLCLCLVSTAVPLLGISSRASHWYWLPYIMHGIGRRACGLWLAWKVPHFHPQHRDPQLKTQATATNPFIIAAVRRLIVVSMVAGAPARRLRLWRWFW